MKRIETDFRSWQLKKSVKNKNEAIFVGNKKQKNDKRCENRRKNRIQCIRRRKMQTCRGKEYEAEETRWNSILNVSIALNNKTPNVIEYIVRVLSNLMGKKESRKHAYVSLFILRTSWALAVLYLSLSPSSILYVSLSLVYLCASRNTVCAMSFAMALACECITDRFKTHFIYFSSHYVCVFVSCVYFIIHKLSQCRKIDYRKKLALRKLKQRIYICNSRHKNCMKSN